MSERYYFLDGLRGVAAIMVALYHFTDHSDYSLLPNAYFSVDLFFVLSGFVIAKSYNGRIGNGMPFTTFMKRRLTRLYPMFFVSLVLGFAALTLLHRLGAATYEPFQILAALAFNAFYIPFPMQGALLIGGDRIADTAFPLNSPAWTLFFELLVNILFYALWRSRVLTRMTLIGLVGCAAILLLPDLLNGNGTAGWGNTADHFLIAAKRTMFGFSAGVLIAALPTPRLPATLQPVIGTAIIALFLWACSLDRLWGSLLAIVIIAPATVYLGSAIRTGPVGRSVTTWLGDISYPIYCVHFPILMAVSAMGLLTIPGTILLGPVLWVAFALLFAMGVARIVETPSRHFLNRVFA